MGEKRPVSVGLVVIMTGFMIFSSLSGLSLTQALGETPETGFVYVGQTNALKLLDSLDIEIIESYDDFQMARLTPSDIATLGRHGVESFIVSDLTTVSMQTSEFDTSACEPATLTAGPASSLYIIQFIGPIKESWIREAESLGIEFHHYIPNFAYLARGDAESIQQAMGLRQVQWIGNYQNAYKYSMGLAEGQIRASIWNSPDATETLSVIREICPEAGISYAEYSDYYEVVTKADSITIDAIAALDGVVWIEQIDENMLYDETSSEITGGIWAANTPYGAYGNYANIAGYDGTNIIVGVCDTGLGNGATGSAGHVDFTARVVGGKDYSASGTWADGHGHGTHCAGIVSANGFTGTGVKYAATQYYAGAGVAPDSKLYGQKIFTDAGSGTGIPTTQAGWDTLFQDAYNAGCYVHSNSWGENPGDGAYEANDVYYDQHVRDSAASTSGQQPLIITVAAGNAGSGANTIGSPASGKNVITVGASENYHPDAASHGDDYDALPADADNIDQIISFSSRGLEDDSRIKPDIAAPGTAILSVRSPNDPGTNLYGLYDDTRYEWCSGTSQANPHIAGASAVIVDWWQSTHSGTYPMPAMVKALLINTATDMGTADIPNGNEGWGRAYLPTIVAPTVSVKNYDNPALLTTGTSYQVKVSYESGAQPLKVSLVYTDAPGAAGANPALVNNLNLRVTAPGGQIYYGNAFSNGYSVAGTAASNSNIAGEVWDASGNMFDDKNNVECVYIATGALQTGQYTIDILAENVPTDVVTSTPAIDQDFALTIYNAVTVTSTGTIEIQNPSYPREASVAITVGDTDLNTNSGTAQTVNVNLKSTAEPAGETVTLTETGVNTAIFTGACTISATNSVGVVMVSATDTITATYIDASPSGTRTDTALVDGAAPAAPTGLTVTWTGSTTTTLDTQDFLSATFPPTGWATSTTGTTGTWSRQTTTNAGGTSPEARFMYGSTGTGTSRLYRGPIDTSGRTSLTLTWNNYLDDYGAGCTMKIQTATAAGGPWTDSTWSYASGSGNLGPGQQTTQLTVNVGSPTFYYAFVVDGNSYYIDYWYVDNPTLTYQAPNTNDNRLDWTKSADDGAGANDVDYYNIYRASASAGPWTSGAIIDTVNAGTITYTDPGKGEIDGINWWYVVRAVDISGNEDVNTVAVPEQAVSTATATATGPTGGPSNVAGISLTYSYTGTPTSVNIYYTTTGGTTWTLAGNDASVNGNYAWTVPTSGTYGWLASAVGGSSTEPSPPSGGTAPESSSYIFDNVAPTISANTFADGATGVATTAGNYDADFSENMAAVGSVTTNLPGATFSWVDANTYRISYTALAYSTTYTTTYQTTFTDVAGNALGGDRVKTFTTQAAPAPTATAAGPIGGPTTVTAITITYTWTSAPTSVNLYYTLNGGTSWTLAGNDASVDGSYAWTCPATGTYGWIASAVGGGSTELSPPSGGTSPEVASYIVDITPPAAATALSVDWWGPVSGTATYTYTGVTQASTNHTAWFCDVDDSTPAELTTPNSQVELTDAQYGNLVTSDNVRAASVDPGAGDEIFTKSSFTINQASSSVTAIDLTVEIQSNLASTFSIFAYDFIGTTWVQVGATTASIPANTDTTILRSITSGASNYVSVSNEVRWGCYQTTATEIVRVDYVMIQVTYSQYSDLNDNTLNWTLSADDGAGADDVALYNIYRANAEAGPWTTLIATVPAGTATYLDAGRGQSDGTVWWYVVRAEDTSGNEELNVLAVPEPSAPGAYSINLAGKLPNSWVFVSFPSVISGNVQDILNDAINGDGMTTWTVAKWYDPRDPADPWKSYRVGGTANDMPTITNTMGIWLWITANGGDQALTLSSLAAAPGTTTNIPLYVGWNMIGYPSMTSRSESATLPVFVDWVSVWQAASPYISDHFSGASLMSHGNAYWVHVTADCVWMVNP